MLAKQVDCLVVGSGAAALAAALTAHSAGLSTMVIEKTECYGGTTALSGGVSWIPNNSLMRKLGDTDSVEDAMAYLEASIGNRVSRERLQAFADSAPEMLDFLLDRGYLEAETFIGFPDYFAERPGGKRANRSVEPKVFNGNRLGPHLQALRNRNAAIPGGLVGTMTEMRALAEIRANPRQFLKAWRVIPRSWWARLTRQCLLTTGAGLIGWLRYALIKEGIPLLLETELTDLIMDTGKVVGAQVATADGTQHIETRAVIICAGGFEQNETMRLAFQGSQATTRWTSGAPGNAGSGIEAGMRAGAQTDLMEDAWWAPTVLLADGRPQIVIFERGKPGFIIVNQRGQRYANEAAPYNEVVKAMQENQAAGAGAVPSHMVFDQTYRDRYPFANMLPGVTPKKQLDSGLLVRADTIQQLAKAINIDPDGLEQTLARFNLMAKDGRDLDFQRGEFAFDRFSGDPSVKPNNCLAALETPPYYAAKLYPGDLGTKGGLLTNEHAQVLHQDGSAIAGLYAAGNASASVMGETYLGAGGTIGPAMTFGYIAGRHAAQIAQGTINR